MQMQGMIGTPGVPTTFGDLNRMAYSGDPTQARMAREGMANQQQIANINQTPARLQQKRFKTVFPWMQQQFGNLMGQFSQNGGGGVSPQGPHIGAGPVISQPRLQEQINAMRARGDQATQTAQLGMANQAAGTGMSSQSPLVQAMQNQAQMANLGQQMGGERDMRMGAATTNANFMLQGQQAREDQFANRQRENIARQQNLMALFPGLLSSIGGMV